MLSFTTGYEYLKILFALNVLFFNIIPRMKISDILAKISDIGDNRSEIGHGNLFEEKIVEKSEISPKFRRYIGIGPKFRRNFFSGTHTRVDDFLLQNIGDISEILVKYR